MGWPYFDSMGEVLSIPMRGNEVEVVGPNASGKSSYRSP